MLELKSRRLKQWVQQVLTELQVCDSTQSHALWEHEYTQNHSVYTQRWSHTHTHTKHTNTELFKVIQGNWGVRVLLAAAVCTWTVTHHFHTLKSSSVSGALHWNCLNTLQLCQVASSRLQFPGCIPALCCGQWDCTEHNLTSTVSEAVQDVSLVAQALEAARVVDAGVVTGSLEGALVNVWCRHKHRDMLLFRALWRSLAANGQCSHILKQCHLEAGFLTNNV